MNDNLQHPSGTRRIAWVDYGKGLAILLVFWGDTICPEPIRIFFYAFLHSAFLCAVGICIFYSSVSVIFGFYMA